MNISPTSEIVSVGLYQFDNLLQFLFLFSEQNNETILNFRANLTRKHYLRSPRTTDECALSDDAML